MDRAEARAILESMKLIDFSFAPKSKATEALDLAIEALRQTVSEDCISREATIKAICAKCTQEGYDECREDCTEVAIVRGMPPVNQKQITSKLENAENATSEGEESTMGQPKSKLKNPDDSLLKPDSEACKEQKSKLDCISRQQAIDEVKKMEIDKISIVGFWELIESLPPVTPTERTGEWKIWNEPGNECVYCNKCKHEYDQIDLYIGGSEYPNYCPNCGAKMGIGGDDNE